MDDRIGFRCNDKLKEYLKENAKIRQVKMSDIIREILEDYYIYEKGGNAL
jgi:hypothetical protein